MSAYPSRTNLLFAVPITGRPIPPDVMFAYHAMACPMNYNFYHLQLRGMEVGEARNVFADHATANECKYIFFWDEDVACPPHSIPELVYKMEHHPEAAIIGGVYCLKREPAEPLLFRGNGNGPYWNWKAGEFFEVSGIGMGCTLVRVEVFKDLKKPWFKTEFNYERMLDGQAGLETWTEDLWFCQRVTDTGKWKIYADTSILCTHYDMNFPCKAYNLPPDSKPVQHMRVVGKKKILDIGSGKTPYQTIEGVPIRTDPDERSHPDYRCDLRKLPFGNKEFDIAFSPALEHFDSSETDEVLHEWMRVVKDSGELRLVVSNPQWVAQQMLQDSVDLTQVFGKRRTAFTLNQLVEQFKKHNAVAEKVHSDPAHLAVRVTRKVA